MCQRKSKKVCKRDIETDLNFCSGFAKSPLARSGALWALRNGAEPTDPIITDKWTRDLELSQAFLYFSAVFQKASKQKSMKKHHDFADGSGLQKWNLIKDAEAFSAPSSLWVNAGPGPGRGQGITCLAFLVISPLICEGRWIYSTHTLHELITYLN